jgi:hypothetical protein
MGLCAFTWMLSDFYDIFVRRLPVSNLKQISNQNQTDIVQKWCQATRQRQKGETVFGVEDFFPFHIDT